MNWSSLKPYYQFTKEQRLGLLSFFAIIISLQLIYFFVDFSSQERVGPEKEEWLSLQNQLDTIASSKKPYTFKMYPFNPNFITDFKGYKLGMSLPEINRLLAFRKMNKYVNSAKEFQQVTKISDSLLNAIAPYFKFPDWVNNPKEKFPSNTKKFESQKPIPVLDINQASKEDLMKIYGIGEAISDRILKVKETLGGFVSMDQMNDVWGLSPDVVQKLHQSFRLVSKPSIKKININKLSIKELSQFYYFKYPLAKEIVTYRTMNGEIKNAEDLIKIKGFPVDKVKIIALYLEF